MVEVLRCCDWGVLNGAEDECCFSCRKAFREKYLRSASKMPRRMYIERCGMCPESEQRPHEGSSLENIVSGN